MHIEKITLRNFKSFGKKVDIQIFKGFTVISGPNGSGKSNIIDSILFCLGLSHTRTLRAEKLTDLIHNGKNCDEAEVTITFKNESDEIKITRKVKKTEKGYYSYSYINGKAVSLSEIHNLLSNYGIYSDAYNVVMQGDVTRIIEMTPMQRRKIIDDIAGISEFDEKKERALMELDIVRENIEKLEAVLNEIDFRLSQLEKDKNEALKYKKLLEEKQINEKYLLAHQFKNLEAKILKLKREIEKLEIYKDKSSKKFFEISNEIREKNLKAAEIVAIISEMGDERYKQIHEKILKISSEIEGIRKSKDIYVKEISKIEDEITKGLVNVSKLKGELTSLNEEIESLEVQKLSVQEKVDELVAKIELIKAKLQESDVRFNKLKDELMEKRDELEKLKNYKTELVRQRDRVVETLRRIDLEIEEIETAKRKAVEELDAIKTKIRDVESKLGEIESKIEGLLKDRNEVDSRIFYLRDKLSSIDEEIRAKEVELAKIKASLSTIQTFSKPVELVLEAKNKKALPGVYGTVSQLLEVEDKYALALEVAAGNSLQFLVVDGVDDAIRAIEYLKQIKGGRATFIPIRKIRNFDVKLDKSILSFEGVIDYAINLIKYDSKFKDVFKFVFRDTVVVDTIENAKKLMNVVDARIVTLEGDLIEKTGLISGGSITKRGMLISKELMEKERKLSREITSLNEEKEITYRELRNSENLRKSLQYEIDELNEVYNKLKSEISVLISKKESVESTINSLNESMELKKTESKEFYKELSNLDSKIDEISVEIEKVSSIIESIEKRLKNSEIPRLTSELEKTKEEFARNKEVLFSIGNRIDGVEFKKNQILNLIHEKEIQISKLESEKENLLKKIEEGTKRIEELNVELEKLRIEEEEIGESIKELRSERDRILDEIRELEKEKARLELEIKNLDETIKAKNELLKALTLEKENLKEVELFEDLPSYDEVKRRLKEIERELSNFGDVNLKAIQEFEEVKSRRDELFEKKLILEKERSEIINRIRKYEKMKREAFYETFNAINKNFSKIVAELTNGKGELFLDSDDPFNSGLHIKVKPYNKPIQRLESMSGGEKSLVALALIFAIQEYKPASFYAFDEIDMFLDGVNVSRVAKLIKNKSSNAQFIVVSLRKPMLEMADSIIGVTLGRDNSSIVTGIRLKA